MCGISGIFSLDKVNNIEERINKMNNSVLHRGPDFGNFKILSKNNAIGHRRLSIIDLNETGNQPMTTHSKVWHIVFNGEIYNFNEIKKELNYKFISKSDTEVILASIEEKGINWFLEKANGMFAIALYNLSENKLFLIRDRLGIKPLYYYYDKNKLIFSSEIKGILSSGLVKAEFNESAVDEYLGNRYIREPYTFFKNIYQVNSGSYLIFNNSLELEEHKYWKLPDYFNLDVKFNENEIADLFEKEILKSIKHRLISDVELGTYLSGGVDSSLITAIAKKYKKGILNTYTIGFQELNEFKYSRLVAERYKTNHHEILMNEGEYIKNWERLISLKDGPLGVPNEIPLAIMSEKLKEKITVVLSGEGADELMGGYGRIFRSPFDYEHQDKIKSFYNYVINQYEYVPRNMRNKFLSTSFEYRDIFDSKIKKEFDNRSNEENIFRFFHNYHVKGLLQRVDMTTMQASVEARVPFLDHNLIEFSYKKIPYDLKLRWKSENDMLIAKNKTSVDYSEILDTPKYLLRKISYNYIPDNIIERKKVGFPVPLTKWFTNLKETAKTRLSNVTWLKEDCLNDLLKMSENQDRSGQVLWMFINIELFREKYFNKNWQWQ